MAAKYRKSTASLTEKFREFLAPGTDRVKKFSIPVKLYAQKNGIRVDWDEFRKSAKVQEQLDAAAKLDLSARPVKSGESA